MKTAEPRGKLSSEQKDSILEAYFDRDEPVAKIARDNKVTPPAIRYVIRRHAEANEGSDHAKLFASRRAVLAVSALTHHSVASGLDGNICRRVTGMVAEFLAALDVAAASSQTEDLVLLQDASDSLMRAIARVRIEVARTLVKPLRTTGEDGVVRSLGAGRRPI
jgi:transposase-like protein